MFKSFLYWLTHIVAVPNWIMLIYLLGLAVCLSAMVWTVLNAEEER